MFAEPTVNVGLQFVRLIILGVHNPFIALDDFGPEFGSDVWKRQPVPLDNHEVLDEVAKSLAHESLEDGITMEPRIAQHLLVLTNKELLRFEDLLHISAHVPPFQSSVY